MYAFSLLYMVCYCADCVELLLVLFYILVSDEASTLILVAGVVAVVAVPGGVAAWLCSQVICVLAMLYMLVLLCDVM